MKQKPMFVIESKWLKSEDMTNIFQDVRWKSCFKNKYINSLEREGIQKNNSFSVHRISVVDLESEHLPSGTGRLSSFWQNHSDNTSFSRLTSKKIFDYPSSILLLYCITYLPVSFIEII